MKKHYPELDQNPDFPKIEEEILSLWKNERVFERSVENRADDSEYIFYDGPPFANGLPHYGHLLTGFVKDVFARYQTMSGLRVERRFGWDCHGLPAEMGAEKELNISGRAAIVEFGIDKFNAHCRSSVMKYTSEWEEYVTRQARWVDFKHDYKTMDTSFMESVLWAFKQLYDKGLVYEAHRVMPYSWAAETPLSNFETKLDNSYREREDKAIYVAFEVAENIANIVNNDLPSYFVAWTTTPWTLPSNLALAAKKDLVYVAIISNKFGHKANYIIAENLVDKIKEVLGAEEPTTSFHGKELIGKKYKPLFPYFSAHKNSFQILDGSAFVTDSDGTGIVHMAPGFGEDDQKCCEENGIEIVVPVDGRGCFTDEIYDITTHESQPTNHESRITLSLSGLNVIAETRKDENEPYTEQQLKKFGLANLRIINYLKQNNQLIKQEDFKHNYPHCWRTDTPLIYRAMPSWYVEVTKFRERAVEINQQINWIPDHIRDGQMAHMLATAPDWSISRNRFWGTPIPVWIKQEPETRNQKPEMKVFGSIAELEDFFGVKVTDLHRPFIDQLTIAKDGSKWRRVEDVFDCWFESGSMPFAQVHYPFENKEWFETHFPADFITEYVGQTRGWFNTMIMLSTALFDKPPFKNCICHGVVLDSETGVKYSKRLKNYKDPMEVMDKFGADALRWLMISSPVMRGHDLAVDPEGKFIRDVVRLAIKPIWNAYNFFCLYANADNMVAGCKLLVAGDNFMDKYILAKCNHALVKIKNSLDGYDTPSACEAVSEFFEILNNWYIRRSKERFWKEEKDADKQAAYDTLYAVLVAMCKAAAPLLPLTLDAVYRGLTGEGKSVHLAAYPEIISDSGNDDLMHKMDHAQNICNAALAIRNKLNIRVRQPLASLTLVAKNVLNLNDVAEIIKDEVNVKDLIISSDIDAVASLKLSINSAILGKRLPEKMKQILPASKKGDWQQESGELIICGEKLLPTEYILQLEPKPEYKEKAQPLSSNDALVILDINITSELEAEGIARDVVRMVQQARKDAGLYVADRIRLAIVAPEKIKHAITLHESYITTQTLASEIKNEAIENAIFSTSGKIENTEIYVFITK